MKLLILKGLPASGKSTWAREFTEKNKDWIRVNRDDLRNMRGVYWIPEQEKLITEWENACIITALENGFNVIIDATNLNQDRNKQRVQDLTALVPDLKVEYKNFDTSLEECLKRDLKRANSVGPKVIKNMYNRYLAPPAVVYEEDVSLPHCVIFDVDGTLAKMNGRSPYDWDKVGEDLPNVPIVDLCHTLQEKGLKIIIFTGRDGSCGAATMAWLHTEGIMFDSLHIRPEGNTEKDAIIKKRMFEDHIRGKYYCEMVIDDRNQVVDMWRNELGLTCLQVAEGDF